MPRFYLTAVAAAVMAATVNAAEFPAFPVIEGKDIVYRSDVSNGPVSSGKESWEGNGMVASGKTITGGNAPAFLSTRDHEKSPTTETSGFSPIALKKPTSVSTPPASSQAAAKRASMPKMESSTSIPTITV